MKLSAQVWKIWTTVSGLICPETKSSSKYVKAIQTDEVCDRLAMKVAGPIDHSRWLTMSIRILQIYTRTAIPSHGLKMIATYICQVYAPMWFRIKSKTKFTKSPSHIPSSDSCSWSEVQIVVKPVIQRNAYFAEHVIMLTSMRCCCHG